ncbi:GH3 auxin-responsive promoter family protein [Cytophagaceae bacterium YF14B1]|uniref:GH3 auxin-responsive promoter family protein n=1 Tax=Xanthocytophaga flava TaxID=3048013 RepID=A0AAE3U4Y6_9BACT|nr:GH3 auxin-responsive promoter family protein [Xanthocytophaga flavus]MDJ1478982.1 GH3 auxin-responsive promoter family protein [Xanthocytophaga flavus]
MAIIGTLLKRGIKLRKMIEQERVRPYELQRDELAALLDKAKKTAFGKTYGFEEILHEITYNRDPHAFYKKYKENVPVFTYNKIFQQWWHKTLQGKKNICWPGKIKYFALSSGTSESSSKHIPVTKAMIKAIHKTSVREILSLADYPDLPGKLFQTGMLALGGSTHLNYNGTYFEGDLSGINASRIPFWFQHFYKPGFEIASIADWNTKLEEIVEQAPKWNIGFIAGVPAWIQILMEKIIDRYQLKTIHDIWPNLAVYTHGGVSFEPYRKGFEKLLAHPLIYIETYLASEGFIAYQLPGRNSMRMVLNNGMFYEFVPFNEQNFGPDGEMVDNPETLMIDQIEEGKEYALLLSTCAGAWRYLIGDVIKFVDKKACEIVITGRTKHFLSLCGEHLSVDNMNKAVQQVAEEQGIDIREFTVVGIPHGTLFAHHWFIGTDDEADPRLLREKIDEKLKILNDDYRVERAAALKDVYVDVVPTEVFYQWMEHKGKIGGQTKFPRVMKRQQYAEWEAFVKNFANN